jgi:lipopolysaccharide/colanic/teichoic acid biosynthesis glycosyltransferase
VLVSVAGLVLCGPVILLLAVVIKLDSPGPAIFRQRRVGRGGRLFTFYKFRTMAVDAAARHPELFAYEYSDEEVRSMYFKVLADPRLTRFGRYLRRTSLDELPNLFSVLTGDITLVGPRPELPEMLRYYTLDQLQKFSVKPGVTGLAQVNGRGVLRFQETIAADLEYCRRRSFWLDLVILVRTVRVVALRVGAF